VYLVDTNVWLERLLDQERSEEVAEFLSSVSTTQLCITDFAFHSISLILARFGETEALRSFVKDAFSDGDVTLLHLMPEDTEYILQVMRKFSLDYDDAYQYVAAEKYNLIIVSFDADFERTVRGRKSPGEVLES